MGVILRSFVIERGFFQGLYTDVDCCLEQVYGDPFFIGYTTVGICHDRLNVVGTVWGSPEGF